MVKEWDWAPEQGDTLETEEEKQPYTSLWGVQWQYLHVKAGHGHIWLMDSKLYLTCDCKKTSMPTLPLVTLLMALSSLFEDWGEGSAHK